MQYIEFADTNSRAIGTDFVIDLGVSQIWVVLLINIVHSRLKRYVILVARND